MKPQTSALGENSSCFLDYATHIKSHNLHSLRYGTKYTNDCKEFVYHTILQEDFRQFQPYKSVTHCHYGTYRQSGYKIALIYYMLFLITKLKHNFGKTSLIL